MKRTIIVTLILLTALRAFAQEIRTGEVDRGIFHQEGIASWYGAEFNGRPTASGEIFNDTLFTAAHPILPFGTLVKVTNNHNQKTVTVRVNDRGPFVAERIIDLSRSAAAQIDMIGTGTAPVTVESLEIVNLPARPHQPAVSSAAPVATPAPVVTAATAAPVPAPVPVTPASAPAAVPLPAAVPQYTETALPAQSGEAVQVRPASIEPYSAEPYSAGSANPVSSTSLGAAETDRPWIQGQSAVRFQPAIPEAYTGKNYRVQVGAYKQPQHAVDAFEKLKNAGLNPAYEKYDDYYRVVLTGLKQDELKNLAERIGRAGFREVLLREEK
ncbi:hypothetical protein AGMMS50230_01470 [Spirochaetia bacterium]|nr:hypothetical protein AGMMS50230_01470 [Spirochaetia bacterium]